MQDVFVKSSGVSQKDLDDLNLITLKTQSDMGWRESSRVMVTMSISEVKNFGEKNVRCSYVLDSNVMRRESTMLFRDIFSYIPGEFFS